MMHKKGGKAMVRVAERYITQDDWYGLYRLEELICDEPMDVLYPAVLRELGALVPYSHSLTYLIRYENGTATSFQYESADIPQSHLRLYMEKFINIDFINWYVRSPNPTVFRESDIIPDALRLHSDFMETWMLPIGLFHGTGMVIARDNIRYGGLFLYRGREERDFSDRDLEILRVVNGRLCRRFHQAYPHGIEDSFRRETVNVLTMTYNLTKREREILAYIKAGVLRSRLCEKLFITENTLNKHLDNIYKKLGIGTFEELLQIAKSQDISIR